MRDFLNKSLAVLIWIATGFNVALSCYTGAMIIRYSPMQLMGDSTVILYGFLFILFGVTLSLVFAGICFQIMDIRTFTKHVALNQRRV
ncbi:hypothetical protein GQF56_18505 [Rhodobacter sphaeroides]|jgi:ABC-type polysaccharide/polyol phosphate export permease|uniref:Uncharacterized protein n=1 Tax=Cereibacter sphaeroides (strain ATCC 17023 / DSM 158 / JCM 6121 / CCUG 31486 / LMG 2827 / NBRC 12203 / NCIMB 8253 / ATH 2.4.1.) TaxID=272943 RepID=Q3IXI5_CERS4|nr:hypothetical protein [Cereibacter sphaeroides]ABN78950.1 conserved hypothetical protein [Cereibacter sphaeroides ATCC 17029]ABA80749.1 hypothetical protein RSP_6164 [Cereibacter sphaeroides 2.4.1]AMJ49078.1 hypothetical protein APX01_16010 [Cereibacter sphaeroides]ANS35794.1 hypothetical protein A3858_16030 [Cereibacter sphaeroides]ATN64847.1 hypothetical protein A3857_16025 [Cereibacter sphaeroides]